MSSLAQRRSRPVSSPRFRSWPSLALAVIASRVLILSGAVAGAVFTQRVSDWQRVDPQHLTLKFGWLGNVLASAAVRWDSLHYLMIARHGYTMPSSTPFFPLYPLLIRAVGWIADSYVVAGVMVSAFSFATALVLLHRLTREELGERAADATVLLLVFSPLSLFFTALYTESLFLALSLGSFLLAKHQRLALACVVAGAAALTHVEGVLLVVPLAMFRWQAERYGRNPTATVGRAVIRFAPMLLPVLALAGFLVYLHSHGFGWLAPSSDERYYRHHLSGPLVGIAEGVGAGLGGLANVAAAVVTGTRPGSGVLSGHFVDSISLCVLLISAATLALVWKRLPAAYGVYSALFLVACVSSPVAGAPLTSLDRYVLVLFPLWMVAGQWLAERRLLGRALVAEATFAFVFALEFARWTFLG